MSASVGCSASVVQSYKTHHMTTNGVFRTTSPSDASVSWESASASDSDDTSLTPRTSTSTDHQIFECDSSTPSANRCVSEDLPRILHSILYSQLPCQLSLTTMFSINSARKAPTVVQLHAFWSYSDNGRSISRFFASLKTAIPPLSNTTLDGLENPAVGPRESVNHFRHPSDRYVDPGNEHLLDIDISALCAGRGTSCRFPEGFIRKQCLRKIFTKDFKNTEFGSAMKGLDWIRCYEATRRESLRDAAMRLELTEENWRNVLAEIPDCKAWVDNMQALEIEVEEYYARIYVDLRVWIMIMELKSDSFYKPHLLATLNSLFPPSISEADNEKINQASLYQFRATFFDLITKVAKDGPKVLDPWIAKHLRDESGHSWLETRKNIILFFERASGMIKKSELISDIAFFQRSTSYPELREAISTQWEDTLESDGSEVAAEEIEERSITTGKDPVHIIESTVERGSNVPKSERSLSSSFGAPYLAEKEEHKSTCQPPAPSDVSTVSRTISKFDAPVQRARAAIEALGSKSFNSPTQSSFNRMVAARNHSDVRNPRKSLFELPASDQNTTRSPSMERQHRRSVRVASLTNKTVEEYTAMLHDEDDLDEQEKPRQETPSKEPAQSTLKALEYEKMFQSIKDLKGVKKSLQLDHPSPEAYSNPPHLLTKFPQRPRSSLNGKSPTNTLRALAEISQSGRSLKSRLASLSESAQIGQSLSIVDSGVATKKQRSTNEKKEEQALATHLAGPLSGGKPKVVESLVDDTVNVTIEDGAANTTATPIPIFEDTADNSVSHVVAAPVAPVHWRKYEPGKHLDKQKKAFEVARSKKGWDIPASTAYITPPSPPRFMNEDQEPWVQTRERWPEPPLQVFHVPGKKPLEEAFLRSIAKPVIPFKIPEYIPLPVAPVVVAPKTPNLIAAAMRRPFSRLGARPRPTAPSPVITPSKESDVGVATPEAQNSKAAHDVRVMSNHLAARIQAGVGARAEAAARRAKELKEKAEAKYHAEQQARALRLSDLTPMIEHRPGEVKQVIAVLPSDSMITSSVLSTPSASILPTAPSQRTEPVTPSPLLISTPKVISGPLARPKTRTRILSSAPTPILEQRSEAARSEVFGSYFPPHQERRLERINRREEISSFSKTRPGTPLTRGTPHVGAESPRTLNVKASSKSLRSEYKERPANRMSSAPLPRARLTSRLVTPQLAKLSTPLPNDNMEFLKSPYEPETPSIPFLPGLLKKKSSFSSLFKLKKKSSSSSIAALDTSLKNSSQINIGLGIDMGSGSADTSMTTEAFPRLSSSSRVSQEPSLPVSPSQEVSRWSLDSSDEEKNKSRSLGRLSDAARSTFSLSRGSFRPRENSIATLGHPSLYEFHQDEKSQIRKLAKKASLPNLTTRFASRSRPATPVMTEQFVITDDKYEAVTLALVPVLKPLPLPRQNVRKTRSLATLRSNVPVTTATATATAAAASTETLDYFENEDSDEETELIDHSKLRPEPIEGDRIVGSTIAEDFLMRYHNDPFKQSIETQEKEYQRRWYIEDAYAERKGREPPSGDSNRSFEKGGVLGTLRGILKNTKSMKNLKSPEMQTGPFLKEIKAPVVKEKEKELFPWPLGRKKVVKRDFSKKKRRTSLFGPVGETESDEGSNTDTIRSPKVNTAASVQPEAESADGSEPEMKPESDKEVKTFYELEVTKETKLEHKPELPKGEKCRRSIMQSCSF